ncbi:unnamed protein product [Rotaria sp. Silwood1]|nr:unnamed protein product [Rotaria sp. Silwood1]CAF1068404.1 unnamed protein product [Rotaria sp. Silwood1]CAF3446051.1 unnamed protein product [Rotaria sp. Silwood1]CAF4559397.1 unnamed protein product [Rotaria sp. Silwood1]
MATMSSSFQISSIPSCYSLSNLQTERKQLLCVVCGSIARGFNFGAITCMSCKIFFRRNAFTNLNRLYCHAGGNCEINQQTRKCCTYCRLLTCFRVGMKRQLIRVKENNNLKWSKVDKQQYRKELRLALHLYRTTSTNQHMSKANPLFIRSSDRLPWSDRFELSHNDWLLLNQLSFNFDSLNYHIIAKAQEIHQQLLSAGIQPLKMRAKASYIYDMMNIFADTALKFVKSIPQFISLPTLNKQALLIRNTRLLIMFYSYYQSNLKPIQSLTQTPYWKASLDFIFLPSTRCLHNEIIYHIGHVSLADAYLIKLILAVLAFSTSYMDHDDMSVTHQFDEYYHASILHNIQNMYIELMWKYMM